MTPGPIRLAVVGTAYHTPAPDRLEVLSDVVVAVDAVGTIVAVEPVDAPSGHDTIAAAVEVVRLSADQRLLPGLVDLHVHAPQWPQLGTGLDLPLERWLFEYTFPLEARYADTAFAAAVYSDLVPSLLAHGTTTAVYYSSIHEDATVVLAEQCVAHGQRAFVGRVAMDHPEGTPEWYRDLDAAAGIDASARSIDAVRSVGGGTADALVQPIITPRFVPACTDDLLRELGALAASTGVRVQTHCSESDWEHAYVLERHGVTDTESLERFGLIREHTVLAHGDHLGADDLRRLASARAGVAHCPLSNAYFANAVFGVRRALDAGVPVGLGTDVAGGASPSLLGQCGHAVTVSRMLEDGVDPARPPGERGVAGSRIDVTTAFHLATAGGADVLGLPAGRFVVGASFDAIVVDVASGPNPNTPNDPSSSGASRTGGARLRRWDEVDDETRLFEKIVRLAGPSDITVVWVAGRRVR